MPHSRTLSLGEPFVGVDLHVMLWGEPTDRPAILCVHGLTRNARDFDPLAEALSTGRQVLAVDVAGRGGSSWLPEPEHYRIGVYAGHLIALLAQLGLERVDWVGTSMGGLIGMVVAAHQPERVRRLVVNDVGPVVPKEALAGIGAYLGLDLLFPDLGTLEQHLRLIHASFGPLSDAQWRHLAQHSAREVEGGYRLHYDPAIRVPFLTDAGKDADIWELYDKIACPTLVLRGAQSTLFPAQVAAEMQARGPRAELVTFQGIGHAPALMSQDQIKAVATFLDR